MEISRKKGAPKKGRNLGGGGDLFRRSSGNAKKTGDLRAHQEDVGLRKREGRLSQNRTAYQEVSEDKKKVPKKKHRAY